MKKIVLSYLKDKTRPEKYCRNYKNIEKTMATVEVKCHTVPVKRSQLGGAKEKTKESAEPKMKRKYIKRKKESQDE
jgi:hypothetical protein